MNCISSETECVSVNIRRLWVWTLEPCWLSAPPNLPNPAVSVCLSLMRAARMHQAFSRFLFSFCFLSLCFASYTAGRQAGSVKYLILFYPLGCHQFQAVLFSFTSVPHQVRYQDLHQLWNVPFHSYGLVQREADEQFSAQSFTCASWPDIPCVETCSFLQTHLWITGFNSMWHETEVTAESIMLHFFVFLFLNHTATAACFVCSYWHWAVDRLPKRGWTNMNVLTHWSEEIDTSWKMYCKKDVAQKKALHCSLWAFLWKCSTSIFRVWTNQYQ